VERIADRDMFTMLTKLGEIQKKIFMETCFLAVAKLIEISD